MPEFWESNDYNKLLNILLQHISNLDFSKLTTRFWARGLNVAGFTLIDAFQRIYNVEHALKKKSRKKASRPICENISIYPLLHSPASYILL